VDVLLGVGLGVVVGLGFFVGLGLGVLDSRGVDVGVGVIEVVGVGVGLAVGVTWMIGADVAVGVLTGDGTTIGSAAAGLPPEKRATPNQPAPAVRATRVAMGTRRLRSGERGTYMAIGRTRPQADDQPTGQSRVIRTAG